MPRLDRALIATVALCAVPTAADAATTAPQIRVGAVFARLSLDDAQARALLTSPDVAAARARVAQGRASLAIARGSATPSIVSSYAQVPQGNPPTANITSRQLTTAFSVTLGDLLARAPSVRAAAFTLAAAEADAAAAETSERVKVAGLYFDALRARAVVDARRDALALAQAQDNAATLRARAGDAPRLDVLRADVALARASADVEGAVAADQNATDALRVEAGVADSDLATTVPATFAAIDDRLIDPDTVVRLVRTLRPEIVSAERTKAAADASVGAARAGAIPNVTVSAGYLTGTDSGVPINAPAINAQVTIPLSNTAGARIALAAANAREAQAKATAIERSVTLDAAASSRSLAAANRTASATARARQSARAELDATELGYRRGASSSLELTSARANYAQAVVDELSANYDLEKARVTLALEIGG